MSIQIEKSILAMIAKNKAKEGTGVLGRMAKIEESALRGKSGGLDLRAPEIYTAWKVPLTTARGDEEIMKDAVVGLFRLLLLSGRSAIALDDDAEVDPSEFVPWRTWLGTLAHLIFRTIVTDPEGAKGVREIDDDMAVKLAAFRGLTKKYTTNYSDDPNEEDYSRDAEEILTVAFALQEELGIPTLGDTSHEEILDLGSTGRPLIVACYYAIVVFLCGRPIARNSESAMVKRPKNLQDKYFSGRTIPELSGSLQMTLGTHQMLGRLWEHDPQIRAFYFRPLLAMVGKMVTPIQDAILTTVNLLAYSKMSHLKIIADAVRIYPFIAAMPIFNGEFTTISLGLDAIFQLPVEERLFAKALYCDSLKHAQGIRVTRLTKLCSDLVVPGVNRGNSYAVFGADADVMNAFESTKIAYEKELGIHLETRQLRASGAEPTWEDEREDEDDAVVIVH